MMKEIKRPLRVACISDGPKCSTGFGNVTRMILQGLHDGGFDVFAYGMMDAVPDIKLELPYMFQPTLVDPHSPLSNGELEGRALQNFLVNSRPDAVLLVYDPGTAGGYAELLLNMMKAEQINKVPIIVYTPIEGYPVPLQTHNFIQLIEENNGKVVTYSPGSVAKVVREYPKLDGKLEYAYHGIDHINLRRYDVDERKEIRNFVGIDNRFVVGSIGVNKRTKGFDYIIYTARCLKDMEEDEGFLFYIHTNPNKPTMLGYYLAEMVKAYDVEDMIIFKPEARDEQEPGGNVFGIKHYKTGIREDTGMMEENLRQLGYVDRLNMLDCYLDLSQVEGWGLPVHEAMACGVPTVTIKDLGIREEIFSDGAYMLDALPFRMWTTWHNGVKLAGVDPYEAARVLIGLKEAEQDIKDKWSNRAMECAARYTWKPTQEKFIEIIKERIENFSNPQVRNFTSLVKEERGIRNYDLS